MEHYFTPKPQSQHEPFQFTVELFDREFTFMTDAGVFSKTEIDPGTLLLISALPVKAGDRVLDLGCGYGPIGIAAAYLAGPTGTVDLIDINQRAVELATMNAALNGLHNIRVWQSDGFAAVVGSYDWIVTNPPVRAGKKVIYPMLEQAYRHLHPGGGLLVVIRTKQGAKSMEKKLDSVFGNVETVKIKKGYRVLKSIKP
ncbi:MAG: class I SAM-dependent methyltransferase [Firmicutes bacterium]|jgi:16S rRNA (guanine1207-N2)-methyltransferase|nr:class I SAM-dependent methyltransferase [Bacillota bacterium]NLL88918.1 class I SAM-dependent methyltransferase [Bacillota bacterium]